MQLRTLTLQAIGPFVGRHTIDFAELGAGGLFLLEGPTGAGKSTVIDAVVFALYGKVASEQASEERLRSSAAGPDTESFVDLVFEVPSGVFRVRRTPQFERTKRRGEGTTTQNSTVRVWRGLPQDTPAGATPDELDAYGEPLTNRPDEAGAAIQRAIGLDRGQFVQTVVLPQGEFAAFLRAKPEDRRVLLQRIFGTQVYDQLTARLVDLRKAAHAGVEAARGALGEALSHFAGAARLADDELAALRGDVDAACVGAGDVAVGVGSAVAAHTAGLAEAAVAVAERARLADEARARARSVLDEATVLAGLLARRDALRAEQVWLEARSAEATERRAQLVRAREAAPLRPLIAGATAAAAALDAAVKTLEATLDGAPDGLVPVGAAPDAALRAHVERAGREAAATAKALGRLVAIEAGLPDRERDVAEAQAAVEELRVQLATLDAWLAGRPAQRTALDAELAEARGRAARLAEHRAAVSTEKALLAVHDELAAARARLAQDEAARQEASGATARAVAALDDLRRVRAAGLAGELAADLAPGSPCPVCGATEHPAPARLAEGHVSAADVEAAEVERSAAERAERTAAQRADQAAGRVEALGAQAGEAAREVVEARLAAADAAVVACEGAAAREQALAAQIEGFEAATRARTEERSTSATRLAGEESDVESARRGLAEATAEVAAARDGHASVAAREAALAAQAQAADELLVALVERERAARDLATRTAERDEGVAAAGFASPEDAAEALLDAGALAALEDAVATFDADAARIASGLAEAAVAALPEDLVVDLASVTEAEREARAAAEGASGAALVAAEASRAAEASGAAVVERARALAVSSATGVPVVRLANLASGGEDARGLTLGTFVLMRRFEDVVAAANHRLLAMSDGRYSLTRSDEREDGGGRRTGLAMRVVDHLTDTPRDPRTLSGGETFYVSLCLALGLADVVTAEAGGIDLGTLFVDEGFGSLDPYVLDQVLAELGKLRAGGRVVGVVSHVESLKQAIADRIEVRPRADGTSTLTVRAG